jgi:hypothetical protein
MTEQSPSDTYPLVEVSWYDAIEVNQWEDMDNFPNKPMLSWSVGYLVAEDSSAITLVSLVNKHHWSLGITIPLGMVEKIQYLKVKK